MADFAPPSGPPPPRVPEGWKAVWNDQYKEWFYVNLHTKASTWEKPTTPALRPDDDAPPPGPPPPGYHAGPNAPNVSDSKKTPLDSNNPYNHRGGETDEEMARRLQREENERHGNRGPSHSPNPGAMGGGERGHAEGYYNSGPSPQPPGLQGGYPGGPQQQPYQNQSSSLSPGGGSAQQRGSSSGGGFFGKLKDKFGNPQGGSSGSSQYPPRPSGYGQQSPYMGGQQHYPQQQGYPQQGGYGGYQPGYQQGYPQGGYMQQPMMAQQQKKKGGLGAGGAAALGVGGGLLGGMLLADAIEDHDEHVYDQGYDQGYDNGGGDDFGGGDF